MCCAECAKCLGGLLIPLMLFGVLTNILLCFPSMTVVRFEHLSNEVTSFGGIIGCGILMFFPAYSFLHLQKDLTRQICGCDICGPRCRMFNSAIYSLLGIVGSSYGIALAWSAIKNGPKCDMGDDRWDYPFHQWDYLTDRYSWNKCKRPSGIVSWNLTLFSIQLGIGSIQLTVCLVQLLNGLLGTVCGQWKCMEYC
ncbi:transmembrane 4 L6 family member 4-like [Trichosurus vulpecula]|uniref:transmembrane 4 L6 family member 4-like n=1 Tax=Trichosurus vulpecula TaxID=9337 RepID=UPI00186ABFA8|nr:transmembrane 4 L6 family member 4-like [Trichosurus vulpecula]XP_036609606.1 transmembrane 4 L6 family member 4-like [Trichosurus vulpecula]